MDLGKIGYRVGVDDAEYLRKLESMEQSTNRSTTNMAGMFTRLATAIGLLSFAWRGWEEAKRYSSELANIKSIASELNTKKLRDEINNLNSTLGKSSELANAVYFAYSAGVRGTEKEIVSFTEQVAMLAKTIGGGVTPVMDAATTIMNAYSLKVGESANVMDWFYQIVKSGKTTGSELAQSLGQIAATAASSNIPLEELGASIATLTTTMPTSVAITSLASSIRTIMNPTAETSRLAKQLGIDLSMSAIQAKGFGGVMNEIAEKTQGQGDIIAKLFPAESSRAIMALAGTQLTTLQDNITAFSDNAGAAAENFAVRVDNIDDVATGLYNTLIKFASAFGEITYEVITLNGALSPAIRWILGINASTIKLVAQIGYLIASILLVKKAIIIFAGLKSAFALAALNALRLQRQILSVARNTNLASAATFKFTKAWKMLNLVVKANPFTAVMAAVISSFVVIKSIFNKINGDIEDLYEQAKKRTQESIKKLENKDDERRTNIEKIKRLEELQKKQHRTNTEIAEAQKIVSDLTACYGDFGVVVDTATGKINTQADAFANLNARMEKQRETQLKAILESKKGERDLLKSKMENHLSTANLVMRPAATIGGVFGLTDDIKLEIQEMDLDYTKLEQEIAEMQLILDLGGGGVTPDVTKNASAVMSQDVNQDLIKNRQALSRLINENKSSADGELSTADQYKLAGLDIKHITKNISDAKNGVKTTLEQYGKGSQEHIAALTEQQRLIGDLYSLERKRVELQKDLKEEARSRVANERLAAAWADGQVTAEEERALAKADIADQQQRITELAKEAKNAASSELKKSINNSINLAKIELGKLEANFKNTGGTINNSTASVTHDASLARLITGGNTAAERTAKATEESALRLKYIKDNTKTTNTTQGVTAT